MCFQPSHRLLKRLTPFDRKLLIVLIILVLASFMLLLRSAGTGRRALVETEGKTVFVAALEKEQEVEVEGPLGETILQIVGGAVQVVNSPCRQKICIGMGKASHAGDLLACVPNRVVVRIEGAEEQRPYDVRSR